MTQIFKFPYDASRRVHSPVFLHCEGEMPKQRRDER